MIGTINTALPPAPKSGVDLAAARRAGEEFESVFLGQMVSQLFAGLGEDPLTGGGAGGNLYRSMMQEQYGKTIARSGGLGIADSVVRQMIKQQEKA